MNTILDQTQDLAGREIHRLTTLYGMPDFCKQASHEQICGDPETLSPHLYGDPLQRRYPCHTKAATWMSFLFYLDKQASYTEKAAAAIEQRLDQAARYFSIGPQTQELKEKAAANANDELTKLANDDFALVLPDGSRHYPLRNAGEVKAAADWYSRYRDEFTFDDRHTLASKILEKAAQHGASLGEASTALEQAAGLGFCSAQDVYDMLVKRATLTQRRHPNEAAELVKTAAVVQQHPDRVRDASQLLKFAAVVDQYDRLTRLTALYDDGLPRPEEWLFRLNEKVASDVVNSHISTLTGNIYEKQALDELSLDDVRSWMGNEFADEVSAGGLFVDAEKIAEIVPTLDRGQASLFDRMLQSRDIQPYAKEAAHYGPLLDPRQLREFADLYEHA